VEDVKVFGDGRLGATEGRENLADTPLSTGKIFQKLKSGWIGEGIKDLQTQFRNGFLDHSRRLVNDIFAYKTIAIRRYDNSRIEDDAESIEMLAEQSLTGFGVVCPL
jgi:hypothetical protein